ncbi:MAG: serine/threonine-protein kinase [Candidatus Aminicenantes bacterium]|nr:serine/threonine-protein kinase [Candidatus Aminicenantes bacterium]
MNEKKTKSISSDKAKGKSYKEDTEATKTIPPSSAISPEVIGNYRIIQKLGEGGMGEVYEAEQTEPIRRRVALKIIKVGMDTKQVVARFESERQALALMSHPSIAKVFDAGATERGRPYFVMECVKGVPITEYCDTHRLNNRPRLDLFVQVCEGMQHAHQKGIIHRDIKASNVLVTVQDDRPVPKIIDFGVAKATAQRLTERTVFTELGQLIGTPEYMSPEQAEMTGLDIDTRTDVYSLGVLLYELLVGVLPFESKELRSAGFDEIRRRIREQEPPKPSTRLTTPGFDTDHAIKSRQTDLSTLTRQLRGELDWITMKAMAKDRTQRYASASELAADILRYMKHEPVLAGPLSTMYRLRKYMRRHKVGVAAAALVVLAMIIGITGTTIGLVKAVKAEKKAREEAQTAQQVSDFLVELFKVSDPSEARGNTITAREILDKGAERIEKELQKQPRIQTRLMETMGNVYRSLGLYKLASPILEKSLEIKRSIYGNEHLEVADGLRTLGILYDTQGKYGEAEALFKESLTILEKAFGPDHPNLARNLNSLAIVYWNQGKYAEAEPLFQRSLAIKEKSLGSDHPEVGNTLTNLGVLYHLQRKFEQAEPLFRRALNIAEKTLGTDHPDIATHLNNLGSLYQDMERYEEAESYFKRCLAVWEKALGPDHSDVGIALHNLANLNRNQGKYEEAEPFYHRSQAIFKKALGQDHPYVAYSLRERANLYREQEKFTEAEAFYKQALEIFEKSLGPDHLNVAETLENYAILLRRIDRADEAEQLEARAKTIRDKHSQEESPR